MSRTDKDLPYWMLSVWWKPDHRGCSRAVFYRGRDCDLPDRPVRERPSKTTWHTQTKSCCWVPCGDRFGGPHLWANAPSWYVRLEFAGPARRRTRDELTRCRQEYRATGEVDTIPDTTGHRHRARWDYW